MKLAKYILCGCEPTVREVKSWREDDDDYIRTTEPIDVEFVDLPREVIVPLQVQAIDTKISEARTEFNRRIKIMEGEKANLLAITCDSALGQLDSKS